MSEFKFSCPHCKQHLECDERFSGKQIQCPACNHLVTVPVSPAKQAEGHKTVESGRPGTPSCQGTTRRAEVRAPPVEWPSPPPPFREQAGSGVRRCAERSGAERVPGGNRGCVHVWWHYYPRACGTAIL